MFYVSNLCLCDGKMIYLSDVISHIYVNNIINREMCLLDLFCYSYVLSGLIAS